MTNHLDINNIDNIDSLLGDPSITIDDQPLGHQQHRQHRQHRQPVGTHQQPLMTNHLDINNIDNIDNIDSLLGPIKNR
jgi:hypothetical protein